MLFLDAEAVAVGALLAFDGGDDMDDRCGAFGRLSLAVCWLADRPFFFS